MPISAVVITLNEENNIRRCLNSIRWVDEIVVVDSGSTDKTKDICREFNCRIFETEWLGFGRTKQFAVSRATHDWILSVDADEEITPALAEEINNDIFPNPPLYAYRIKRKSFYLGKMVNHCGWNRDYTLRLFNRLYGNFNQKTVHEFVDTSVPIGKLKNYMLHYPYPTRESHLKKMKHYAELGAQNLYNKGKSSSLPEAVLRAIAKFGKMFIIQAGFLDGNTGLILSCYSAYGVFLKYKILWQKTR